MKDFKENQIDHDLMVMETVEKELNKQRHDTIFCLVMLLCCSNFWVILVALWEMLGRPIGQTTLTVVVEVCAAIMLLVIIKFTRLKLADFGLKPVNMKNTIIRALIISISAASVMIVLKLILHPGEKLFDLSQTTPFYPLTAVLQEFIARGFLLTSLVKLIPGKKNEIVSLICSSLLFSGLHLYYGFYMMIGAGVLSFVLGIIYLKDRNIWGVSIIHYVFGAMWFILELP